LCDSHGLHCVQLALPTTAANKTQFSRSLYSVRLRPIYWNRATLQKTQSRYAIAPNLSRLRLRRYTVAVRIALGQINTTIGDFSGNSAKIIDYARRARSAGVELILFPELAVCGYPPRDLVERPWFVERNRQAAEAIARETQGIAVICGLV